MKNVINSFSRDLWLSKLTEGWLMMRSHMSNNKVTYPCDHAVTWGHMTNELHYIFILRSLLPLNLAGWWLLKLKPRRPFNKYMVGFSFSQQILTQLKKFLRWRYFVPKALLFFHQFHQFPEKYLCGPSCFKNSGSQSGKKILISTTVKFPIRNLNNDLQNISNWK